MNNRNIIFLICFSFVLMAGNRVFAQDSTKKKTIDITSTFKPVLRDAAKINFNAAPPVADTARPRLSYNIPSQYLFLNYQPGELKPVALIIDSLSPWQNMNYVKLGFGNVHQPFIQTGFHLGDGKNTFFNIYANEYNSKGSLPFQKNSLTDVAVTGTVKTPKNLEWTGKLGFKSDYNYLYGYKPDSLKFSKSDLQQRFQTFEGRIAMRNMIPTEYGLTHNPDLHVSVFSDSHNPSNSEANTVLNLPLEKSFGNNFSFRLGATADLTNYREKKTSVNIQNNLFYVTPALFYHTSNFNLQASIVPSWDNKVFNLMPNFLADITTNDQRFTIQLGWIGYYQKGSYQRFASINPWLEQPTALLNTRVQERYAGFKGSIDNHFSYSAKVGFQQYWNMPLFVNDYPNDTTGKVFGIRYEPSMQALQLHGELTYQRGEEFSWTTSLNFNQYTNLKNELKAWGLLPIELNSSLRLEVLKDLFVKLDLWLWSGAQYLSKTGHAVKAQGAFDLNAGVEFKVARQVSLWLQMDNLMNDKYERWHQYQTYGFNMLGGIIFTFGSK